MKTVNTLARYTMFLSLFVCIASLDVTIEEAGATLYYTSTDNIDIDTRQAPTRNDDKSELVILNAQAALINKNKKKKRSF